MNSTIEQAPTDVRLPTERVPTGLSSGQRLRRVLVALTPLAVVLLFLWYIGVFGGNVRTVQPGMVYRSAQLTGDTLANVLKRDNIRTVINLRGRAHKRIWYRSEVAVCRAYGVDHVDVRISASKYPDPAQLAIVLQQFHHARYPILFHCQGGSDRSGLVGTIYLTVYEHVPLDQAEAQQLTWRYGHMRWGSAHAMNDFFDLYRRTSGGLDLRTWMTARYPSLYAKLPPTDKASKIIIDD
jgi:hypothetical protein